MSARWRLAAGHYIHVLTPDGTAEGEKSEWEYTEQSRESGRMVRRRFKVPKLLDPRDPADWNYPNQIVVADAADERFPNDYIMEGEPTADMIPLNKSAQEVSAKLAHKWKHPIDTLPGQFSASLLQNLEEQFSKALANAVLPQANQSTSNSEIDALKELIAKQGDMIAHLMGNKAEPAKTSEPAQTFEPLPEIKDPEAPLPPQRPLSASDDDEVFAPPPLVAPYANANRPASTPPKRI